VQGRRKREEFLSSGRASFNQARLDLHLLEQRLVHVNRFIVRGGSGDRVATGGGCSRESVDGHLPRYGCENARGMV